MSKVMDQEAAQQGYIQKSRYPLGRGSRTSNKWHSSAPVWRFGRHNIFVPWSSRVDMFGCLSEKNPLVKDTALRAVKMRFALSPL